MLDSYNAVIICWSICFRFAAKNGTSANEAQTEGARCDMESSPAPMETDAVAVTGNGSQGNTPPPEEEDEEEEQKSPEMEEAGGPEAGQLDEADGEVEEGGMIDGSGDDDDELN